MIVSNLLSITANDYLSAAIWVLGILILLYLARSPFHRMIKAVGNIIYRTMRTLAAATVSMDGKLAERNRRVLLAAGRSHAQRLLNRELKRIHSMVARNAEDHPKIQRQLSDLIDRLESDYTKSADAQPSLPEWIPVIKTIAEIDHREDTLMGKMLGEIHQSLNEQQKAAAETYRQTTAKRHRILSKWMPLWRKIQQQLTRTETAVTRLSTQAETIDRHMAQYEAIDTQAEQTEDILKANAWKQFFISGLMLAISIGAGFLNYRLLSTATGVMITTIDRVGSFTASQATALVIVLTCIGIGVFLMEALRITSIFPGIGSMDEVLRRRFVWVFMSLLIIFAALQGLLIYLAPGIASAAVQAPGGQISVHPLETIGPAVLGFLMPIALGFAAIALETFTISTRAIGGFLARVILAGVTILFRVTGSLACATAKLVATLYDFIIFPAVWLEDTFRSGQRLSPDPSRRETGGATPAVEKTASESSES